MFSHLALISVEPANSFWPRKLLFKALVEHFIPRLQVVDEKEAVRFPRRLLIQLVELLLRQQGAELLHHGVQLVLVAQPPAAEELLVGPHGCADEPQLLRPGADLHMTAPDEQRIQGAVGSVELRHVHKVVAEKKDVVQFLHLQLLGRLRDLALLLDDAPQRRLVPLVPARLLPFSIHSQVLLDVLLDRNPAVVDVDGRAKDVDPFEDAPVLLQNQADQSHGFPRFGRSEQDTCAWDQGHHGVRGLFAAVFWRGEKLSHVAQGAPPRGVAGDMEQHVAEPEHAISNHCVAASLLLHTSTSFWPDLAMTFLGYPHLCFACLSKITLCPILRCTRFPFLIWLAVHMMSLCLRQRDGVRKLSESTLTPQ